MVQVASVQRTVTIGSVDAEGQARQYLPVRVRGMECHALIDSGNTWRSVISEKFMRELGLNGTDLQPLKGSDSDTVITTAKKGERLECLGETRNCLYVSLGGMETKFKFRPAVIKDLSMSLNLGSHFLHRHRMDQLHSTHEIQVQGHRFPLYSASTLAIHSLQPGDCRHVRHEVGLEKTVVVPAHQEVKSVSGGSADFTRRKRGYGHWFS